MSMLFFDGFDGYDHTNDMENYGGWKDSYVYSTSRMYLSTGRNGIGNGLFFSGANAVYPRVYAANDQAGKTIYVGFAFKDISLTGVSGHILSFTEIYNENNAQAYMYYDAINKKLELRLGNNTVLATSSMTMIYNTWYYLEVKFLCDSVSGVFELKINESVVATYTGNTQNKTTSSVQGFFFGDTIITPAAHAIDDVYILNSDGAINNTYLGDVQCTLTYPSADYSTTFTPTGAVSNYLCVDDALGNPDEDTTYVSSSTVGNIDEYSLPNIVASEVHAVKVNTRAMKDDANPRNMKHGIRTGTKANETEYVLGEGYGNYIDVYDDQGDGTPWDETSFNAARSMIKVQS